MSQKKENNVEVGVRVRPRNEKEVGANMPVSFVASPDETSVQELDENGIVVKHWPYDYVFGPNSTNKYVFETMGMRLVDAAMEGYNTVMFMYGQTSSGKTFTLFGGNNTAGVVQHAMEHVYHRAINSADTEYVIKLTYAELYNEEIKDLLSPTPNENLKIIDDPQVGPLIQNVTEVYFTTPAEVKNHLDEGENRRHFGVTNMNAHSSRSHVIVRLHIESRKVPHKPFQALRQSWGKDRPNCISTLNLVDLAGSERANKAGTTGQGLREGSYINKSLLTLGTVISNLSEGKLQHIPYRNSKLTRLLATALGGNAKTCVITCISPASGNIAESLNTLRFATRAKRVVNLVQKNEIMDMKTLTSKLALQLSEIENLRQQLDLSKQLGFVPGDEDIGETLREKAVFASKNFRSLRFLIRYGASIMSGLRSEGYSHLSKKVTGDLRGAILGEKNLPELIDEYSTIVQTYLPKNRRLLQRLYDVSMQNEAEAIISHSDMINEVDSDDESKSPRSSKYEEDLFSSIEFGSEELREQMECLSFDSEHIRMIAYLRIQDLKQQLDHQNDESKKHQKQLSKLEEKLLEKSEQLTQSHQSELEFKHQIEQLKQTHHENHGQYTLSLNNFQDQLGKLQLKYEEQENVLQQKQKDILNKDNEIEKYKNTVENMNKELSAANTMKKSLEDDISRTRSEMRTQMDRLRNNMHEILLQGGEESKVIQHQNTLLSKENDQLKDELQLMTQLKESLDQEVLQRQKKMAELRDEIKAKNEEINALKEENSEYSGKTRDLRVEINKLKLLKTKFEEELKSSVKLSQQMKLDHDRTLEKKANEYNELKERMQAQLEDWELKYQYQSQELHILQESLEHKSTLLKTIESSYSNDITRIEKKLSHQLKLTEDLNKENHQLILQQQTMSHKHQDEIKNYKNKIQEQQQIIDDINRYLDVQTTEIATTQQLRSQYGSMMILPTMSTDSNYPMSYYDYYYYEGGGPAGTLSPLSRHNSMQSSSFMSFSRKGSFFNDNDSIMSDADQSISSYQSELQPRFSEGIALSSSPSKARNAVLVPQLSFMDSPNPSTLKNRNSVTFVEDEFGSFPYVEEIDDDDVSIPPKNSPKPPKSPKASLNATPKILSVPSTDSCSSDILNVSSSTISSPVIRHSPFPTPNSAKSNATPQSILKSKGSSVFLSSPTTQYTSESLIANEGALASLYDQILSGLTLSTILLQECLHEDSQIRITLMEENDEKKSQQYIHHREYSDLHTLYEMKLHQYEETSNKLHFQTNQYQQLFAINSELQQHYTRLREEYHECKKSETNQSLQLIQITNENSQLSSTLNKIQLELSTLQERFSTLKIAHQILFNEKDELLSCYENLQIQYNLIKYNSDLLQYEKQKLISEFSNNPQSKEIEKSSSNLSNSMSTDPEVIIKPIKGPEKQLLSSYSEEKEVKSPTMSSSFLKNSLNSSFQRSSSLSTSKQSENFGNHFTLSSSSSPSKADPLASSSSSSFVSSKLFTERERNPLTTFSSSMTSSSHTQLLSRLTPTSKSTLPDSYLNNTYKTSTNSLNTSLNRKPVN